MARLADLLKRVSHDEESLGFFRRVFEQLFGLRTLVTRVAVCVLWHFLAPMAEVMLARAAVMDETVEDILADLF